MVGAGCCWWQVGLAQLGPASSHPVFVLRWAEAGSRGDQRSPPCTPTPRAEAARPTHLLLVPARSAPQSMRASIPSRTASCSSTSHTAWPCINRDGGQAGQQPAGRPQALGALLVCTCMRCCSILGAKCSACFVLPGGVPAVAAAHLLRCNCVVPRAGQQHRQHLAVGGPQAGLHVQVLPHLQRQQAVVVVGACGGRGGWGSSDSGMECAGDGVAVVAVAIVVRAGVAVHRRC